MPPTPPPDGASAAPAATRLAAGSVLWRVHQRGRCACQFKPVKTDEVFGGGRFDSTGNDSYDFLYAATDQDTALLETLVRGIPFDHRGWRWIRRVTVAERQLSALVAARDLKLVSLLSTADLAAVRQDEWLVQADPPEYPQTRRWGHWLRAQAGWADGFVWPSRRNLGHPSYVLFEDRCHDDALREQQPACGIDLDGAAGADWLNQQLARYRVRVSRPRSRRSTLPTAIHQPGAGH
jgi:RES domain